MRRTGGAGKAALLAAAVVACAAAATAVQAESLENRALMDHAPQAGDHPPRGATAPVWGSPDDPMTSAGQRARERAKLGRRHLPSPVVFPDQQLPLRFSHRIHTELLECVDCHGGVRSSLRASDVNLPPMATCTDCHDLEEGLTAEGGDPPSRCSTCHVGYQAEFLPGADVNDWTQVKVHPPEVVIPTPNLKFNHKLHLDRGMDCATCHGDLTQVELATRDNALPLMKTCLTCHDGQQASAECRTCHLTEPTGRLETRFAAGRLVPGGWYYHDAHDDSWLQDHRAAAQLNEGYCANCHAPKECVDCHNGVTKPLKIHPNDWILQHPVAARKNAPDCASCHRSQTFCVDCHQLTKVAGDPQDRANVPQRLRFHPEGWVAATVGPDHHRFEAQRNIQSCTSCHTERTCVACHSGDFGANPHPIGFAGSLRCREMARKNDRACVKCHQLGSPRLECR